MDNDHDHENEEQRPRSSHAHDVRRNRVVVPPRAQIDWARAQKNINRSSQQKVVRPHNWNEAQKNSESWNETQQSIQRRRDTEVKMPDRVPQVYFIAIAVIGGIFGALRGLNNGVWPFSGGWLGLVTGAIAGVVLGLLGGSIIILIVQEVAANMSKPRRRG
ncbi:MAG TPA: hypothetical protein VMC62_01980 [Longilinea sp.]|nr:hypothetical protein [Longilinea sp.]